MRPVTLEISTPALLFPAISLLFLSFTNRFLHLAALIRHLHGDWLKLRDEALLAQIDNIRRRLKLIRWMQMLGAISLLLCVGSMIAVLTGAGGIAVVCFWLALVLMGASLLTLVVEIYVSGGALAILLAQMDKGATDV